MEPIHKVIEGHLIRDFTGLFFRAMLVRDQVVLMLAEIRTIDLPEHLIVRCVVETDHDLSAFEGVIRVDPSLRKDNFRNSYFVLTPSTPQFQPCSNRGNVL